MSKIKCDYKVLVTGNHDAGNRNYERKHKLQGKVKSIKEANEAVRKGEWFNGTKMVPVSYWSEDNPRFATELYYDNRLFDEIYDGPLFIRDKIVLSHERIELPFAIDIHGHEHTQPFMEEKELKRYDETYKTYLFNLAADAIDFKPKRLDEIVALAPLSGITSIHRMTIDNAAREIENEA